MLSITLLSSPSFNAMFAAARGERAEGEREGVVRIMKILDRWLKKKRIDMDEQGGSCRSLILKHALSTYPQPRGTCSTGFGRS